MFKAHSSCLQGVRRCTGGFSRPLVGNRSCSSFKGRNSECFSVSNFLGLSETFSRSLRGGGERRRYLSINRIVIPRVRSVIGEVIRHSRTVGGTGTSTGGHSGAAYQIATVGTGGMGARRLTTRRLCSRGACPRLTSYVSGLVAVAMRIRGRFRSRCVNKGNGPSAPRSFVRFMRRCCPSGFEMIA